MAKNRRKARWKAPIDDTHAFTPLVARCDVPVVKVDESARLSAARLTELLEVHGVSPQPWMHALEARVGGMEFGELYFCVYLGFRNAFTSFLRRGEVRALERTPDGDVLLRIGIEGDTHYFLTEDGQAWAQDGIADRHPHWEAHSFDELSAQLCWPVETRA